jgi:hypothetical protein
MQAGLTRRAREVLAQSVNSFHRTLVFGSDTPATEIRPGRGFAAKVGEADD